MQTYETDVDYKGETGVGVFKYETENFFDADIGGMDGVGVSNVELMHIRLDGNVVVPRSSVEIEFGVKQLAAIEHYAVGSEIQTKIDDGEL